MTENITRREWEALSAYLDGELLPRERVRLEKNLQERQNLRAALVELRRTHRLLRSQPTVRSPRNFTLTPSTAGVRPVKRTLTGVFNSMRLASALASALFVLIVLGDVFLGSQASRGVPMTADTQAIQELAQPVEEAAVEEAPVSASESLEPPLALQGQEESEDVLRGTGTPEAGMTFAMPPGVNSAAKSAYPAAEEPSVSATLSAYPAAEESAAVAPFDSYPESDTSAQIEEAPLTESATALEPEEAEVMESGETVPGFWTIWRFFEVGLVILGVITGALAFYLRRTGRA